MISETAIVEGGDGIDVSPRRHGKGRYRRKKSKEKQQAGSSSDEGR